MLVAIMVASLTDAARSGSSTAFVSDVPGLLRNVNHHLGRVNHRDHMCQARAAIPRRPTGLLRAARMSVSEAESGRDGELRVAS
jgi:hypothetical protein